MSKKRSRPNVFVLGHRGMLGNMLVQYLSSVGYSPITSPLRYDGQTTSGLIETVRNSNCDWVINALGAIPQKKYSIEDLFRINAIFPFHLRAGLRKEQNLIHASTDCVFAGDRGLYSAEERPDAKESYGISKALGELVREQANTYVIRASMIGTEQGTRNGLLEWILGCTDRQKGFTNHLWNGITTLEWAKLADRMIAGEEKLSPLIQPGTKDVISKYEILKRVTRIWEHSVEIVPTPHEVSLNRSLRPSVVVRPLTDQLIELHAFTRKSQKKAA